MLGKSDRVKQGNGFFVVTTNKLKLSFVGVTSKKATQPILFGCVCLCVSMRAVGFFVSFLLSLSLLAVSRHGLTPVSRLVTADGQHCLWNNFRKLVLSALRACGVHIW